MERGRLARFGLVFGLAGLFGCAPVPTPQVAVAPPPVAVTAPPPAPPAPPPMPPTPPAHVVAVVPPQPVVVPPLPPPPVPRLAQRTVILIHRVHHYRRYAAARTGYYGPPCGSIAHPCTVYHAIVSIQ